MRRLLLAACVCALSVSVSGQGVRIRHRVLSAVATNAPTSPDSPSPADGSTINTITPILGCVATGDASGGALSYTISFGTNTPPTNIANGTSLGADCSYATATLSYSTTYYWRITATNSNGSTVGSIWSFSTEPDPGPGPNPDVTCLSTTTSPTGHQPMSWTPCRQDIYDQMEADFLAVCPATAPSAGLCASTPATMGGRMFKFVREMALGYDGGVSCTGGALGCLNDFGQYNAWMYQATGDAAWVARGYVLLDDILTRHVDNRPFQAAPNNAWKSVDANVLRETGTRLVRVADWLNPGLTGPQRTRAVDAIAMFIGGYLHRPSVIGVLGDSDQSVGTYFAAVTHHLVHPEHAMATSNFTLSLIGGLVPTVSSAAYPGNTNANFKTLRNVIQAYVELLAVGGEWMEGGEYNLGTTILLFEGADAVKTKTGIDYFPEVATLLAAYADFRPTWIKPDLTGYLQWADTESPRAMLKARTAQNLLTVSGLLQGTLRGQKVWSIYLDLVGKYGLSGFGTMSTNTHSGMGFIFANPYDTVVDWRTTGGSIASGARIAMRNSDTSTTASQFQAYYGGPQTLARTNNVSYEVQHQGTQFGDWELWRNGSWAFTHPKSYGGPTLTSGDGNNSPMMHFYNGMKGYNGAFFAMHPSTYTYVTGTTGGAQHVLPFYNPPPIYNNEWTREMLYVPGTTDSVIIYDRANIINPFPDLATSRYSVAVQANLHRFEALHHKILVHHMWTLPVLVGNTFTSTTQGGEVATMKVVYPASFASTIYDETATMSGWNACCTSASNPIASERKFQVKVYPTDDVLWNTFLTTYQVGTQGVATAIEDAGKAQCVELTRPLQADVLACFNSEAGASLNPTAYHSTHAAALDVVRYRESGYTITWTASAAASTLVLLQDLNPANSWTIAIDGGAPSALNGTTLTTNKGHYTTTISGAGSHTIVVVGT